MRLEAMWCGVSELRWDFSHRPISDGTPYRACAPPPPPGTYDVRHLHFDGQSKLQEQVPLRIR
jgi:hypothetical protein